MAASGGPVFLGGEVGEDDRLWIGGGMLVAACGCDHRVDRGRELFGHARWELFEFGAAGQHVQGALHDRGVDWVQPLEEVLPREDVLAALAAQDAPQPLDQDRTVVVLRCCALVRMSSVALACEA
ncbi:MAG: hypothetical protein ACRD0K_00115 [Egibacteraceae bacterium]